MVFEWISQRVLELLVEKDFQDKELQKLLVDGNFAQNYLLDLFEEKDSKEIQNALQIAFQDLPPINKTPNWGELHQQRFGHPFQMIPIIGSRFRIATYPVDGGSRTLYKTAHRKIEPYKDDPIPVSYGANSRHISFMDDIDENYFVLLGGQDGWLFNQNISDQLELWKKGEYIRTPLSQAGLDKSFKRVMSLE